MWPWKNGQSGNLPGFDDGRGGPPAKEDGLPLGAGKEKEMDLY
jgi:hypothetical protein